MGLSSFWNDPFLNLKFLFAWMDFGGVLIGSFPIWLYLTITSSESQGYFDKIINVFSKELIKIYSFLFLF